MNTKIGNIEISHSYVLKVKGDSCGVHFRPDGKMSIGCVALEREELEDFITALRHLVERVEKENA